MNNEKIRAALAVNNVRHWQLAELLGISDSVMSKLMRHEMPDEVQDKIVDVINSSVKGESFDNSFNRVFMKSRDKRVTGGFKTIEGYARYIARGLDEAEKRRMEGGWDLSL